MEFLRQNANPLSLQELILSLKNGKISRRAVVITFDDGYADNLYHAKPVLEQYEIPASVFVTVDYLGREFWWDELASILITPESLPKTLKLYANGQTLQWTLNVGNDTNMREQLILSLYRLLQQSAPEERQKSILEIQDWAGGPASGDLNSKRALKTSEIIELAKGGPIEIGAHTMSHPLLAALPAETQQFEIKQSKLHLEEVLGKSVASFSYPNGSFSRETANIVRNSGFTCGCASHNDIVWRGSDRFCLPRFWIPDWDGAKFSQWLQRWLHA
jgi:peptidoglycan/xylan/chitin deacetylase (PgdA/CDA1 family)